MSSGPMRNPCSDTGRLESDVNRLESALHNKADTWEISDLKNSIIRLQNKVESLEYSNSDLQNKYLELLSRIESCEEMRN